MKFVKIGIMLGITCISSQFMQIDFVKSNHFNLITINSVFIGFLFTSLSILLGFLNESIVQLFEEAGTLKNVYLSIENGISCSLCSIVISLLNILFSEKYILNKIVINSLYGFEIMFIGISIYYLFFTLKNLKIVVNSINIDRKNRRKEDEADKEVEDLIKNITK